MATIRMFGKSSFRLFCCDRCHLEFWVPVAVVATRWRDGRRVWCPAGHANVLGESEGERLRMGVEHLRSELLVRSMEVAEAKGSVRALRGWVTRLKGRLARQKGGE